MATVTIQKVPRKEPSNTDIEDGIARFCFLFQQYTFAQARRMPYKRILQMLKIARQVEAGRMFELTQVVAAPHSHKQKGVKEMIQYYKGIMEGKDG